MFKLEGLKEFTDRERIANKMYLYMGSPYYNELKDYDISVKRKRCKKCDYGFSFLMNRDTNKGILYVNGIRNRSEYAFYEYENYEYIINKLYDIFGDDLHIQDKNDFKELNWRD